MPDLKFALVIVLPDCISMYLLGAKAERCLTCSYKLCEPHIPACQGTYTQF
jgi:hypothetical protein